MDKKTFWPYAIVLSFIAIIIACAVTIIIALKHPVEMDSSYMQSYQNVDENITFIKESEKRFDEKFDLKFEPNFNALNAKLKFHLTPKKGEISALKYEILLTRPQTNKENKILRASWQENDLVSEETSLKEGRWQLLLRLSDTNDTRYYKFDLNVTK
ncbi:FixH family protein [Campylobacter concisus]|jgi:putative lipoprotein|uniref:4-hydroxy-3-methylbut-2-en-1-yl diphosphate synthase n=1 Tax=Campylobacter concisus TaxID=199 RepID=A0AAE7TNM7_9BACT|nr:FixH family protein [Campylobacter concisus]QPH85748.1 4-hydroxy-3-methylbut-2-en-1-yl diphosphate synthase [Campylobacter concisus]